LTTARSASLTLGEFQVNRVIEEEAPFAALDYILPGVDAELLRANADWLTPRFVDADGKAVMSFQSFVLRTPRQVILIDTCAGNDKERVHRPGWHQQQKPYLATLAAAGVTPEQVTHVFCTHLHADHVGWNTRLVDGRWVPTFQNARYLFAREEYDFWSRAHRGAEKRGGESPNHGAFADSVLPVVEAGRADIVEADHEIDHGLYLQAGFGHTPGCCMLHAKSGRAHGIFIGDIMHTPVQLAKPALSSRFCEDAVASAAVRAALCETYAGTETRLFPTHFPDMIGTRIARHRDAFKPLD
jgi:glyoxylase-like metal-dependent hydrolase (beta-lactamase superfamily II)